MQNEANPFLLRLALCALSVCCPPGIGRSLVAVVAAESQTAVMNDSEIMPTPNKPLRNAWSYRYHGVPGSIALGSVSKEVAKLRLWPPMPK